MKFTAQQIATVIQGKIIGNETAFVKSFSKIEESKEGDLCFLANPKYEEYLYTSEASVVIVNDTIQLKKEVKPTLILVKDAYASFALLLKTYQELISKPKRGIEPGSFIHPGVRCDESNYIAATAYISEGVQLGKNVRIYPHVYIGDGVIIGDDVQLFSGVKIYHDCRIGNRVIIHSGTVIGSDGFGFAFNNGKFDKIPQIGNVVIEDDVEIGANCTIDRATMGSTLIGKGSKLDNLIQVAHNVEIGQNTVVAAQAGISGSTKIGNYVQIGGQAGIVGHIKIADGTRINAQSGVSKEVSQPNTALTGSPANEYRATLRSQVIFKNLPKLQERVEALEKELKNKKE